MAALRLLTLAKATTTSWNPYMAKNSRRWLSSLLYMYKPSMAMESRNFEPYALQNKRYFFLTSARNNKSENDNSGKQNQKSPPPARKFGSGGPVSWQSLAAILLAGGLVAAYVRWEKGNKREEIRKQKSRTIGIASLGGEFTLTDHTGKVKTNESFLGQWIIIYFGFTHCPDICPDELDKLTAAIKIVDDLKKVPYKLQPLFVSVDPERDTPKQMAEYITDFHPRLIGLTGTKEQIDKVTKAYRVYYSFGPKDSDNDYIVDHSIIMYLIDPEGNFKEYYGQNRSAKEIAASAVNHMLKYKAVNG